MFLINSDKYVIEVYTYDSFRFFAGSLVIVSPNPREFYLYMWVGAKELILLGAL